MGYNVYRVFVFIRVFFLFFLYLKKKKKIWQSYKNHTATHILL